MWIFLILALQVIGVVRPGQFIMLTLTRCIELWLSIETSSNFDLNFESICFRQ